MHSSGSDIKWHNRRSQVFENLWYFGTFNKCDFQFVATSSVATAKKKIVDNTSHGYVGLAGCRITEGRIFGSLL
jgi:hypothetical protein